jgi:hypothetical protein
VKWVYGAKERAALVIGMSDAFVDLRLGPIQWILKAPSQAWHVLEAVDAMLGQLREMPAAVTEART